MNQPDQPTPVLPTEGSRILPYASVTPPIDYMPPLFEAGTHPYHRQRDSVDWVFLKTVLLTAFIPQGIVAFRQGYSLANDPIMSAISLVFWPMLFAGVSTLILRAALWTDHRLRPRRFSRGSAVAVVTGCGHTLFCVGCRIMFDADMTRPQAGASWLLWLLPPIVVPVVARTWLAIGAPQPGGNERSDP